MTTGSIVFYDSWANDLGEGVNHASDTFKIGLCTSTYTPNVATHALLSDITNEVSGNGYARQTLTSVTYTQSGGVATFDFANPVFTASGGSITARYYFIYDDTLTSPLDPLVCYGLLDTTPADVTATDGNTITINVNASGLYTVTLNDA